MMMTIAVVLHCRKEPCANSASLAKSDLQSLQSDIAVRKIGFHFFVVCEIGFRCPAEIRLRAREIRFGDSEIGFSAFLKSEFW